MNRRVPAVAFAALILIAGCKSTPKQTSSDDMSGGPDNPAAANSSAPASSSTKLDVRGITVGMTHDQLVAAGKAAGMTIKIDTPVQLKLLDPTATGAATGGASASGGHGLILTMDMRDGKYQIVTVQEQGDTNGSVYNDLSKKWGRPIANNPNDNKPYWGNLNGVWAEYDGNVFGFYGYNIRMFDKKLLDASAPPPRQGVKM